MQRARVRAVCRHMVDPGFDSLHGTNMTQSHTKWPCIEAKASWPFCFVSPGQNVLKQLNYVTAILRIRISSKNKISKIKLMSR